MLLGTFHRVVRARVNAGGGRSLRRVLRGRDIHAYEIAGSGTAPPIVLVHGIGGTANSFFALFNGLRRDYRRVYAIDLPGHGFSPLGAADAPLDVHGHYDVLTAFLDEVVKEPAVVVGNSMGGALALKTAIDRPETPGLALLAPAGAPLDPTDISALRTLFDVKDRRAATTFMSRVMHRAPPGTWLVSGEFARMFSNPAIQHVLAHVASGDAFTAEAIGALRMPVTFVWGASEKILPASGLEFFRKALPAHARIEVLDSCGHIPMIEKPKQTLALLKELAQNLTPVPTVAVA